MNRGLLSVLLAVLMGGFFVASAMAQSNSAVLLPSGCGTGNITNGQPYLTVDAQGRECVNGTVTLSGSSATVTGNVGGYDAGVLVTPTLTAGSGYAVNNSLGGLQTVPFFRTTGQPSGIFRGAILTSKAALTSGVAVYVFDNNPSGSTCTDKSAVSVASADIPKLAMQSFTLTPVVSQGITETVAQLLQTVSIKNQDAATTTNLYICLVATAVQTPVTATDYTLKISGSLD